jgi:formyl-CoA transferase
VFPTRDGRINIAATGDRAFTNFVNAIGLPELATDERFKSRRARGQHRPELREICEAATQAFGSEELIERLNDAGVPAGPILAIDEVFANPQVKHLGMAAEVQGANRKLNLVRPGFNLSRTPPSVRTAAPAPGAHTHEVLAELGLDETEVRDLVEAGVVAAP